MPAQRRVDLAAGPADAGSSIAEFRRLHSDAITQAGGALIAFAGSVGLIRGESVAIDGSRFRAVSSAKSLGEREALCATWPRWTAPMPRKQWRSTPPPLRQLSRNWQRTRSRKRASCAPPVARCRRATCRPRWMPSMRYRITQDRLRSLPMPATPMENRPAPARNEGSRYMCRRIGGQQSRRWHAAGSQRLHLRRADRPPYLRSVRP